MLQSSEAPLQDWYPTPEELAKRPLHTGYAIDPEKCSEVDDAIEIIAEKITADEFIANYHIANGGLLHATDHVDYASKKGWSVYSESGDNNDLMFEEEVLGLLSLDKFPGTPRPALTIQQTFNKAEGVTKTQLFLSQVAVECITYNEYTTRYKHDDPEMILMANAAKRFARHKGLYVPSGVHFSEKVVGTHMIGGNSAVAEFVLKENVPVLRRLHTPEAYEVWHDELERRVLKSLDVAIYGCAPKRHRGLGLRHYSHTTSPLRRYSDLVNHINIQAYLEGRTPPYTKRDLEVIAHDLLALYIQRSWVFKRQKEKEIKRATAA